MPHFEMEHPGLLFVAATLLPLASFVLLLCAGGLRWLLRPHATEGSAAAAVYQGLGGDVGGSWPAHVALGAIALACVCSITGFVLFLQDHHETEHEIAPLQAKINQLKAVEPKADAKAARKRERQLIQEMENAHAKHEGFEHRWTGEVVWAGVFPKTAKDVGALTLEDSGFGTMLRVGYRIDMLAAIMFVMVTFVATLIHLFSMGYMGEELAPTVEDHEIHLASGHYRRRGRFGRFFMFLSLFCFSMLNLLLADNLFQVFVSWELVGVCSFLLIGFYYERSSASSAANKAFITNRVGDAGFIIGVLILWTHVGTLNFQELFARIRAPEHDAHHVVSSDYAHRFMVANRTSAITDERGNFIGHDMRLADPSQPGTDVLVLPRNPAAGAEGGHAHLHFEPDTAAYAYPKPDEYGYFPYWMLVLAGLGIFLGCVGKSAQFPLQVWLPDAMEGPTPVSALIHAATMVAAGVYLVGRCFPLFAPEVLLTIAYTGAITLFVAATTAIVMTDIKKVLAYSTVSQLGYMMLALGVGGWAAGLLHLLTHAFFKALLFLGSGSVIYGCHHQQDMLKMGGLYAKMKITALTMLMGVLAIAGTPFFSGWYSKDAILVHALSFVMANPHHALLFALPLVTAGITTFYMFRMWFMTFTGPPRDHHVYEHAHETPWLMTTPLILLAILSVCVAWGWPTEPGQGFAEASWLEHQLHHAQPASVPADFRQIVAHETLHHWHDTAGMLALLMVAAGLSFAYVLYYKRLLDPAEAKEQFAGVHRFLLHKWYFDEFYSAAVVRPGLVVATWCRAFDTHVIDAFVNWVGRAAVSVSAFSGRVDHYVVDGLVNVIADAWYATGSWLRTFQTGYLRSYVLFLVLAAVAVWLLLVTVFGSAVGAP